MLSQKHLSTKIVLIAMAIVIFAITIGGLVWTGLDIPFVCIRRGWSIGIYKGTSPLEFSAHPDAMNPVLTAADVTDVPAQFVADPFMVREKDEWYLFMEVKNGTTHQGDIGVATSKDGHVWKYEQIVLNEGFHLSYPQVFKWQNNFYMIPESQEAQSVRLYKATVFPTSWTLQKVILSGRDFVDPSIVRFNGRWWLFVSTTRNETLYLYSSDDLTGPWKEHPRSPIVVDNPRIARPGGRVTIWGNKLIRFTQDNTAEYGRQLHAFEITTLTVEDYAEIECKGAHVPAPVAIGWNSKRMHHIDPHFLKQGDWLACVDGDGSSLEINFGRHIGNANSGRAHSRHIIALPLPAWIKTLISLS